MAAADDDARDKRRLLQEDARITIRNIRRRRETGMPNPIICRLETTTRLLSQLVDNEASAVRTLYRFRTSLVTFNSELYSSAMLGEDAAIRVVSTAGCSSITPVAVLIAKIAQAVLSELRFRESGDEVGGGRYTRSDQDLKAMAVSLVENRLSWRTRPSLADRGLMPGILLGKVVWGIERDRVIGYTAARHLREFCRVVQLAVDSSAPLMHAPSLEGEASDAADKADALLSQWLVDIIPRRGQRIALLRVM